MSLLRSIRRHPISSAMLVVVATLLVLVSGAFSWSRLYCRFDEVDISFGRVRHARSLLYVPFGERIEETRLSRAAPLPSGAPDWRRANTFSPGLGHSPHHRFHGAIAHVRVLTMLDEILPFEYVVEQRVADDVLRHWRTDDSDQAADRFVQELWRIVWSRSEQGAQVLTKADLP